MATGILASLSLTPRDAWVTLLCVFFVYRAGKFAKKWAHINWLPGYRALFAPMSAPGALTPHTWWNLTHNWSWILRENSFFNWTHEVMAIVPVFGPVSYYVGSADVAAQLLSDELHNPMLKHAEFVSVFKMWGENLLTIEGEMWKRHRRVIQPAFNTKTYSYVLQETTKLYYEILDATKWKNETSVVAPDILYYTQRLAFFVVARCGFGMDLKWEPTEKDVIKETGVSVAETLVSVLRTHLVRMLTPTVAYKILPLKSLANIEKMWTSLRTYLYASVEARKDEIRNDPEFVETHHDMFTRLVASALGLSKYSISDEEIIGNIFVMMFAGHETTGMVLSETLAFLALYPEEQEKAYQEVSSVIGNRDPTDEDLTKMPHTLACFVETARMYPPGNIVARTLPRDVVCKVTRPAPAEIVLKQGTLINFDMISIHRNPRDFPEPDVFKPSRWYGVPEPQLTMFGFGPRACIGRKFSHVEALTFLSLLLRDWKVDIELEQGETKEQFTKRVMGTADIVGFTFGVAKKIPIHLTRRK